VFYQNEKMSNSDVVFALTLLLIAYIIFVITKKPVKLNPNTAPCVQDSDCVPTKKCSTSTTLTRMCIDPRLAPAMSVMINGNNTLSSDCSIYKPSTVLSSSCILKAFAKLNTDAVALDNALISYITTLTTNDPTYASLGQLNKLLVSGHIPVVAASSQLVSFVTSAYNQILPLTVFDDYTIFNAGYSVFAGLQASFTPVTNNFNSWAAVLASAVPGYPQDQPGAVPITPIVNAVTQVLADFTVISNLIPMMTNQAGAIIQFAE